MIEPALAGCRKALSAAMLEGGPAVARITAKRLPRIGVGGGPWKQARRRAPERCGNRSVRRVGCIVFKRTRGLFASSARHSGRPWLPLD